MKVSSRFLNEKKLPNYLENVGVKYEPIRGPGGC